MVDVIVWRAYSAEHSLPQPVEFRDQAAVEEFVAKVVASTLWNDLVPQEHEVVVISAPFEAHQSWLERDRSFRWRRAELAVHPEMRWEINLLHELAHGAAPHYRYVSTGNHSQEWPPHREVHPHGELWASTLVRLVDAFAPDQGQPLRAAYEHYGVPQLDDEVFAAAVAESHRAEAELAAWLDATAGGDERVWGLMAIAQQQESETARWAKRPSIGTVLVEKLMRHGDGTRGVDAMFEPLVDLVSPVVDCNAQDLETICRNDTVDALRADREPAEADRLGRVATAAMIALDVDPIFMRVHFGLTRWNSGLTEAQVEQLNEDWWRRVKSMNALLKYRPSRWNPETFGGDVPGRTEAKPLPSLRSARESMRRLLRTRAVHLDAGELRINRDFARHPNILLSVDDVLDRLAVLEVPGTIQIAAMQRADQSTYYEIQIDQAGTEYLAGLYPSLVAAIPKDDERW